MLKIIADDQITYEVAVVEIKTKTRDRTKQAQITKLADAQVNTFQDLFIDYSAEDSAPFLYKSYVDNTDHRVQCLHHAGVFQRTICIYVVAVWQKIVRLAICRYGIEVIRDHMTLMSGVRSNYLSIFDHIQTVPVNYVLNNAGPLRSLKDLHSSISLTNGLRKFVKDNGPQRTARQILPVIVSMWNATKGGVDQTSRYLKDTEASMDAYLSPTQRLWIRTVKIWLLNALHLYRNAKVYKADVTGKIKGFRQYRRMTTSVITFQVYVPLWT